MHWTAETTKITHYCKKWPFSSTVIWKDLESESKRLGSQFCYLGFHKNIYVFQFSRVPTRETMCGVFGIGTRLRAWSSGVRIPIRARYFLLAKSYRQHWISNKLLFSNYRGLDSGKKSGHILARLRISEAVPSLSPTPYIFMALSPYNLEKINSLSDTLCGRDTTVGNIIKFYFSLLIFVVTTAPLHPDCTGCSYYLVLEHVSINAHETCISHIVTELPSSFRETSLLWL